MPKYYISFGQSHVHSKGGKTFDKDCLGEVEANNAEEAHTLAMMIFDEVFYNVYTEEDLKRAGFMDFFPRGIIKA